jgi:hypothetical protein
MSETIEILWDPRMRWYGITMWGGITHINYVPTEAQVLAIQNTPPGYSTLLETRVVSLSGTQES